VRDLSFFASGASPCTACEWLSSQPIHSAFRKFEVVVSTKWYREYPAASGSLEAERAEQVEPRRLLVPFLRSAPAHETPLHLDEVLLIDDDTDRFCEDAKPCTASR
jgi:hypothetical protein